MHPFARPPWHLRALSWLPFVASAALVATGIHLALDSPWLAAGLAVLSLLVLLPRRLARRRAQKLLASGDVDAVLSAWSGSLHQLPHRETIGPLITATALAAHGLTERARAALDRAVRGPAWEASLEHRLFVETLLDAFEGDRERAIAKAETLSALPLPPASPFVRDRVHLLRSAAVALARAFAHESKKGDAALLEGAARKNPLVRWCLRYAAAVVHVDRGKPHKARRLIQNAPEWPAGSAFREFHQEIASQAGFSADQPR